MEPKYINPSTWMRDSLHLIGHKNLFDLVLPGTHDSAAYEFSDDYMPGSQKKSVQFWINLTDRLIKNKMKNIEITQTLDIYHQLKRGARYLDIRAGWFKEEWFTYHCHVGPRLSKVLSDVKKFLEKYKCEVVILEISHFRNHTPECFEKLQDLIRNHLGQFLCHIDPASGFPIFNIIKTGKRAIVMMPKGFNKNLCIWSDKILKNSYPNKNNVKDIREYNEKRIKDNPKNKLLKVSWILTPAGSDLNKNLLKLAKDVNLETLKSFSKLFVKEKANKSGKLEKAQKERKEEKVEIKTEEMTGNEIMEEVKIEEITGNEIMEEVKLDDSIFGLEKMQSFNDSDPSSENDDEEAKMEEVRPEEIPPGIEPCTDDQSELKPQIENSIKSTEKNTDVLVNQAKVHNHPIETVNVKGTIIIIDNFGESSIMHIIYKLNGLIK